MSQNQKQTGKISVAPVVILTGGGSGGHITPLLSLGRALKAKEPLTTVTYIGLRGDKISGLEGRYEVFDDTIFIPAGKFRRYHGESVISHLLDARTLLLNVRDFFMVITGTYYAWRALGRIKPNVIFLKGGFVGVPVALAARLRGVATVTHDSDVIAGLANRIAGRWATVHTTGMPLENYNYPKSTMQYVGIPLDERIKNAKKTSQSAHKRALNVPEKNLVLLITGGGLGSQRINDMALAIVPGLLFKYPKLTIFHITGTDNEAEVKVKYMEVLSNENYKRVGVIGFTDEFYKYSGSADLIVTRAGATNLAEFAAQQKACIVIPSPFLAGGHQLKNSVELAKSGAIAVVDQENTPEILAQEVAGLLDDKSRRLSMAKKFKSTVKTDADEKIADILLKLSTNNQPEQ